MFVLVFTVLGDLQWRLTVMHSSDRYNLHLGSKGVEHNPATLGWRRRGSALDMCQFIIWPPQRETCILSLPLSLSPPESHLAKLSSHLLKIKLSIPPESDQVWEHVCSKGCRFKKKKKKKELRASQGHTWGKPWKSYKWRRLGGMLWGRIWEFGEVFQKPLTILSILPLEDASVTLRNKGHWPPLEEDPPHWWLQISAPKTCYTSYQETYLELDLYLKCKWIVHIDKIHIIQGTYQCEVVAKTFQSSITRPSFQLSRVMSI